LARLLFVDDHPLYREGVRLSLEKAMPDLEVALAASAEEAIALLASGLDVDLCLADLRLPGKDGLELLEAVGARWPTVARGLFCAEPTAEASRRARAMGCVALLAKSRDMDELTEALGLLFSGCEVFDLDTDGKVGLSDRRRRVLELAAQGLSNKQIARDLGIGERTVKDHWSSIFAQLEVGNRAQAVSRAYQLRLI
jgi:DNA-binding NarL/FixJ family response regulator